MSGEENPLLGGTPRKDRESHEDGQIELDSIRPKPECDPSSMLRGSEAQVPKLALEAADADDSVDFVWSAFAYLLKILFSFGAAPSLWMTTPEGSRDKHDRARRKMVDLFSLPNVAIASHYWNVGLAMNFLSTPIAYYLVDSLNAEAAVINQYSALTYLPWCIKVFVGLVQDSIPFFGQHRKPYFIAGWVICCAACGWLAMYDEPSIAAVNYLSLLYTFGYLVSDVTADALIVERSVYEKQSELGLLRTEGYIIRSVGGIVGAILGAILYNKGSWGWGLSIGQCCLLQALIPIATLAPLVPSLLDTGGGFQAMIVQLRELWDLVQRRTVWWPMSFVFVYSALQISNPVWTNYLVEGLGFSNFELGVITIASSVFSWLALYIYKAFFFDVNWQYIYYFTTLINVILSVLQLLLVFGETGDIPKLVFATGDYAFISFSMYMQFMPMVIVALSVIPGGIEGASYAMLTTWMNVAGELGYDIGTSLTDIWDVSNCALAKGKVYGLWRLTVLTSAIQLAPIFLIWMFPRDKQAVFASLKHEFRSKPAGAFFIFVLLASILGTLLYSIVTIYDVTDDDDDCDDDDDDDNDD